MSQLTCGDVTVSESDEITPDDVSLSNCTLSSSSITPEEPLAASVEALNTLEATSLDATIALTAPRAAGDLPTVTASLDPGEQVRVEAEITGNTLGVSPEPFEIGWEVVSVNDGPTLDPIEQEPIQLESAQFR